MNGSGEDPRAPARGFFCGLLIAGTFWFCVLALVLLFFELRS
jgi:hypothetical protein